MRINKNSVSLVLLCGGLLLAVCSIFCFFGSALKLSTEADVTIYSSVFIFIFGGNATVSLNGRVYPDILSVKAVPILTIVFVIEIIVILLAIAIIVIFLTKKLDSKKVLVIVYITSALILLGAILALASKNSLIGVFEEGIDDGIAKLGGGLIAYIVLSFISVASNVANVIFQKKAA